MRYFINTIIVTTAIVLLVGATVAAFAQQEDEYDTATVVVTEYSFGNTKRSVMAKRYAITHVDPSTCDAAAQQAQLALRTREAMDAARVNHSSWVAASTATCVHSMYLIPSQTVVAGGLCVLQWDEISGDYVQQLDTICSTP